MLAEVKNILRTNVLPSHDEIFNLADAASTVLETESPDYRPESENGKSGSLLDFQNSPLPLIVVPDIHARPHFMENILDCRLPEDFVSGEKVYLML